MTFAEHRRHYRQNHRTTGCKITHMFGVPIIVASLPALLLLGWKWALACFAFGWFLQFIGHFVFEKNKPVLFSDPSNPFTYFYAVIFVAEEWWSLLSGAGLSGGADSEED